MNKGIKGKMVKRAKGFTVIEVLIALAILSVGIMALISMMIQVVKANAFSDKMTKAAALVQDKMEELRRLQYEDAQLTNRGDNNDVSTDVQGTPALFTSPDHSDAEPDGDPAPSVTLSSTLQRVWNVADNTPNIGSVTNPKMKTVTVIVGWQGSKAYYVAAKTFIHEYQ